VADRPCPLIQIGCINYAFCTVYRSPWADGNVKLILDGTPRTSPLKITSGTQQFEVVNNTLDRDNEDYRSTTVFGILIALVVSSTQFINLL